MSVAVNVGFAAVIAVRSNGAGAAAEVFPGALRRRRIIRDVIVVSLKCGCKNIEINVSFFTPMCHI